MKKLIILILSTLILLSCSVQKRKYQKGFYVSWHAKTVQEDKKVVRHSEHKKKSVEDLSVSPLQQEAISASAGDVHQTLLVKHPSVFTKAVPDSCDEIIFKSGESIMAKISEVNSTDIKYRKCDMADGPQYVSRKSEIFMVKYQNGTREVFQHEPAATQQNSTHTNPYANTNNGLQRTHPLAILALVLGILGIYPLTGIASIFALIFGSIALRRIRERPDLYRGEGMARTGKIMGLVMICVVAAIILLVIAITF